MNLSGTRDFARNLNKSQNIAKNNQRISKTVWSVLQGVWFHLVEVCPLFQEFLQCFLPLQDGGHPVLHRTASDGKTVNGGWNSPKSRAYCITIYTIWNVFETEKNVKDSKSI
jgi:hypothetical protein